MAKIASFNVENLFERPKAFRATDMNVAEPVLAAHKEVNEPFKKPVYTDADKARILQLRGIGRPAFACPANCVTVAPFNLTRWRRGHCCPGVSARTKDKDWRQVRRVLDDM